MREFRLRTALIAIAALAAPLAWLGACWMYQRLLAELGRAEAITEARWHLVRVYSGPENPAKDGPRFVGGVFQR